jgi:hypothetical protein
MSVEGLIPAMIVDFDVVQPVDQLSERMNILKELATHFVIKKGSRHDTNQYGHLELWQAAKSVNEKPDSMYNPWTCLASAENGYTLACMSHLNDLIERSREVLVHESEENRK